MNPFVLLILAICAELCGTTALKMSLGFTKLVPSLVVATGYGIAFWLMSIAIKTIPIGVAYAIWSGVGTAGIALIGVFFFHEKLGAVRIAGIFLIVAGVVLLNLFTKEHAV